MVTRSSSLAWVDAGGELLQCALRGKLRQAEPCVAGDRVRVKPVGPGAGVIEETLPRRSLLARGALTGEPGARVTAANLDRVAVVVSAASPAPRWGLVDRILVEVGREGLSSFLLVNKIDLAPPGSEERRALDGALADYRAAGVPSFTASALDGSGLQDLREELKGRTTVFSGHSGVGKTSLLNALVPGLDLFTRQVNPHTGKGRHTTTSVVLVKLPEGGYAADSPGFREFALSELPCAELGRHYPEFLPAIALCRFKDCLHREEPGCALRGAVAEGRISKLRYQNYLQILGSLIDRRSGRPPRRSAGKGPPDSSW